MAGALEGIRILDLSSDIAGPLGVLLLAEQGADVVKVEPPGGDPARAVEGTRVWWRSRRSVTLDLQSEAGTEAFAALVATADIVVETHRPATAERLGLDWPTIRSHNPRAILVSAPGYPAGHRWSGRPGIDALVQASSGQQWSQPGWRMGPIFCHMPMPSMGTAFLVAAGALAALHARERTGLGQHVRTSLLQGAMLYTTQIWQYVQNATAAYHELMAKSYPPGIHQQMIFECAGGQWIHVSVMSGLTPKASLDQILEVEGAPEDPFEFMAMPAEEREKINENRRAAFRLRDRDELAAVLRDNNHAAEPVIPMEEGFAHPQLVANDMSATVADPDLGPTTQIGVPIHMLGTPGAISGPRPHAGEHNDEVLGDIGLDAEQIRAATGASGAGARPGEGRPTGILPPAAAPPAPAADATRALEGVRILDFGQYLAGPFGPMILGDLGAEVIKIEPPRGDGMRLSGKPFIGCQRGKRSVAIDLKDPKGLEVALELVRSADVVHHNMTKGVASRIGLDYEACRAVKPDIIYCNTYAYGKDGPLSHFGGLDPLYQAAMGIEYEAGATHTGNTPLYYRFGMCDTGNAMLSVVGVLAALAHRDRTGEGQELWTSLLDAGAVFSSDAYLVEGKGWDRPRLDAGLHGTTAVYRLYETQDGWIQIAAPTDADFVALCRVLGRDDLVTDPRFSTATGRHERSDALTSELAEVFTTKTAGYWNRFLDEAGVPNEVPVNDDEGQLLLFDADAERLRLVASYEHPILGSMRQFGELVNFSETPGKVHGPPPLLGQHTREVLGEAGYDAGEIAALEATGAILTTAVPPPDDYPFGC